MRRASQAGSLALLAVTAAACFGPDPDAPSLPPAPPASESRPRLSNEDETIFGTAGELLPSDERLAGLALPRGLEPIRSEDREHVYKLRAPLAKVQAYFGPRLVTTEVTRIGAGVVYRAAVPRDVRGGQVKLDVSILPGSDGTVRVQIVELPPPPPSLDAEARQALFERVQREAPVLD